MIVRLLFFLSLFSTLIYAHQTALSYLELIEDSDTKNIQMLLKKPAQDMQSDDLKIELPRGCEDIVKKSLSHEGSFILTKRTLWCGKAGLGGKSISISNFLQSDSGVIFSYKSDFKVIENRLLTFHQPLVSITKDTKTDSSLSYLWLGIEHILSGYDHLLFVLALMLLVSNLRVLVATITAFTISHSLTLGLAMLGMLEFPTLYVEAMIALSILFLAREIVVDDKTTLSFTYPWIVAFIFGLLHGLGFASSLFEIGLDKEHIALSLFFFNLGVEVGQLGFIALVLTIMRVFYKLTSNYHEYIRKTISYLIGITASYWFLQRIFAMGFMF